MLKYKAYGACLLITLLLSCNNSSFEKYSSGQFGYEIISENDSTHFVHLFSDSTSDKWALPYPVYQFQIGDINDDGKH